MYLGPHHFQAQSRYFEDSIRFATSALWFEPWGLVAAQLDPEALKNGTASLIHARGIFRDGMVFQMPESDPLPEPRNITDLFPPVKDSITLSLAAVPRRPEGSNTFLPEEGSRTNGPMRFRAEVQMLFDETTGRDEKPVHMGRKNIALRVDTEPAGEFNLLPIARISRDGSGNFVYDPEFIPPNVAISASARLMSLLGRLIEILEDKNQKVPIQHHHIHFWVPESAIPQIQAWYAKYFGAKPGMRGQNQAADIPGANLSFSKTDMPTVTTKGRVLDHIGFDVKNLEAFCKNLEASGIKLDRPYTKNPQTGGALAFIYDPWGTYIELNERPNPL